MSLLKYCNTFPIVSEVANVCLFLASDESSYINCASLEVTGRIFVQIVLVDATSMYRYRDVLNNFLLIYFSTAQIAK